MTNTDGIELPHGDCHCGSCADAFRAALRYRNLEGNKDCSLWRLRVAAALYAMASAEFVNDYCAQHTNVDIANVGVDSMPEVPAMDLIAKSKEGHAAADGVVGFMCMALYEPTWFEAMKQAWKGEFVAEEV